MRECMWVIMDKDDGWATYMCEVCGEEHTELAEHTTPMEDWDCGRE